MNDDEGGADGNDSDETAYSPTSEVYTTRGTEVEMFVVIY